MAKQTKQPNDREALARIGPDAVLNFPIGR